jgi:uncharacterized protein YjbI with pentapeptide repeats
MGIPYSIHKRRTQSILCLPHGYTGRHVDLKTEAKDQEENEVPAQARNYTAEKPARRDPAKARSPAQATWKTYLLYGSLVMIGAALLFSLVQTVRAGNTGFETKTLWDWMELLIVPIFLAGGAFFLEHSERKAEQQRGEDQRILEDQRSQDRTTAEQIRADKQKELEQAILKDGQQEAALQGYLNRMADLLLKEKLRVTENEELKKISRIQTLTVLRGLDGARKGMVLRFLWEAELLARENPVIKLTGADLSDAELSQADLSGADLSGVDLKKAKLSHARLQGANLRRANLYCADIMYSNLSSADLSQAELGEAQLDGATLTNHTNLQGARLHKAILIGAFLQEADLRLTYLRDAELNGAHLNKADLRQANLSGADLTGADLTGARLDGATLTDARVTEEQVATARFRKGAILPGGRKQA